MSFNMCVGLFFLSVFSMFLRALAGGLRRPSGVRRSAAGGRLLGLRLRHSGAPQRLRPRLPLQQLDQHHHEEQLNAHVTPPRQNVTVTPATTLTGTHVAFVYKL